MSILDNVGSYPTAICKGQTIIFFRIKNCEDNQLIHDQRFVIKNIPGNIVGRVVAVGGSVRLPLQDGDKHGLVWLTGTHKLKSLPIHENMSQVADVFGIELKEPKKKKTDTTVINQDENIPFECPLDTNEKQYLDSMCESIIKAKTNKILAIEKAAVDVFDRLGVNEYIRARLCKAGSDAGLDEKKVWKAVKTAETHVKKKKNNIGQILEVLYKIYDMRYNEIRGEIEVAEKGSGKYKSMTDRLFNTLLNELRDSYMIPIGEKRFKEILYSDYVREYNPITEYFDSLPEWDGVTDHIKELWSCITPAEGMEDISDLYCHRWMINAAGTMNVIIKQPNNYILMLKGPQGRKKTTFLNMLVPVKGYSFTGHIDPEYKDDIIKLAECCIINLDDAGSTLDRKSKEALKSYATKPEVYVRRPWGRHNEISPRIASICGSIDKSQFLDDMAGNRRFLIIEIEHLDLDRVTKELVDKAWKQAHTLFLKGEKCWFDNEEIDAINIRNEEYQYISVEEELIKMNFAPCPEEEDPIYKNATEIMSILAEGYPEHKLNKRLVGFAMTKLNFQQKTHKSLKRYMIKYLPQGELFPAKEYTVGDETIIRPEL